MTFLWVSPNTTALAQDTLFESMYEGGKKAYDEGHYLDSEKKLKSALREAEHFAENDKRLRDALNLLADVYDEERKYAESEALYRRLVALDEKQSNVALSAAEDLNGLAISLKNQSKFDAAQEAYLRAEKLLSSQIDKSSAVAEMKVSVLLNLTTLFSKLGKYDEAEEYVRKALAVAESDKQSEILLARVLDAYGEFSRQRGRFEEAESFLDRSLAIKKKLEPDGGIETAHTLLNAARLYRVKGDVRKATEYVQRATIMQKRLLGEDSSVLTEAILELATIYEENGRSYQQAIELLEKYRPSIEKNFGEDSPRSAEFLRRLSNDYIHCNQYTRAQTVLERALAIDEGAYGKDSPEAARDLNFLGTLNVQQGKYQEAEPLFKKALVIVETKSGANHPDTATCLNNMAFLFLNQRKFGDARPLVERALKIRETVFGAEHPMAARNVHMLAQIAEEEGKLDEAETLLKRAYKIQKEAFGQDHDDTIDTMADLAELCMRTKKLPQAEDLYRKLLAVDETASGADSAPVAADLDGLSRVLIDLERSDEAKPFVERSNKIKAKLPGGRPSAQGEHGINIEPLNKAFSIPSRTVADKWALVIGISNFKDPSINLQFAAKDAMDFRNHLVFEENFKPDHVKTLIDQSATRDNIVSHLGDKWLRKVAKKDDLVVIYLSSHGTSARKEVGKANFIVAYETNLNNAVLSGIPMQWFTAGIRDLIPADRIVIVMDVCHGGALRQTAANYAGDEAEDPHGKGSKALMRGPDMTTGELNVGTGEIIIASSEADQVSWESTKYPNGVFTRRFIEGLRSRGPTTTISQAYKQMRARVEQEVLRDRAQIQTPIMEAGSWKGGDLVLSVKPTAPRSPDTVPAKSKPISADSNVKPTGNKKTR